jgi:hypothetical protein
MLSFCTQRGTNTTCTLQTIAVGEDTSLQHLDIKFDCNMSKASSSHNALYYEDRGWQRRRIVVTAHEILFFKERATRILDVVALHGISRIYFASKEELKRKQIQNERQKLSRKSSMMPTQSRKGSDDRSMDVSSSVSARILFTAFTMGPMMAWSLNCPFAFALCPCACA